jgi:hypothetical protein
LAERLRLPWRSPTASNSRLLKNVCPGPSLTTVSMVTATPELRTVKLTIKLSGEESPMYLGGRLCRTELATPIWSSSATGSSVP